MKDLTVILNGADVQSGLDRDRGDAGVCGARSERDQRPPAGLLRTPTPSPESYMPIHSSYYYWLALPENAGDMALYRRVPCCVYPRNLVLRLGDLVLWF